MRQPIASKLAELREAIGRIPPHKTARRSFTKAQRAQVYTDWDGMCGCGCEESLDDQKWEVDHRVPLALGGAHEAGNWVPLLEDHHLAKTRQDIKAIAKCNRILKRENEGPKPSQIHSRNEWPTGQKIPAHVDPWCKRRRTPA